MKRTPPRSIEELKRRVSATDGAVIDELYGLEPVYEPDAPDRAQRFATVFVPIECPYCWERYETEVDLSAGSSTCIEDCQVCCRPIEISSEIDDSGRLLSVRPERMD